ncbi:MAG: hypothetical protein ABJE47_01515 [bacterium]
MPLSGRHDDPLLDQLARDTFALFPHCCLCGQRIDLFEHADIRVHVQRVVHKGPCPSLPVVERLMPPER